MYNVLIRQQPVQALVTSNSRYRRPVDPAPILQLYNPLDSRDTGYQTSKEFVMHCQLYHKTRNEAIGPDEQGHQPIFGSHVSSLIQADDVDNSHAAFFPFSEITLRVEGTFRLIFRLMELINNRFVFITSIITSPFTAVDQKCWKGMFQSTHLDIKLASQGIKVKQKNETDHKRGAAPLSCQSKPPTFPTVETPSTFEYPANPGGGHISDQSNSSPSGSGGNYSSDSSPNSGRSRVSSGGNPDSDTTMLASSSSPDRSRTSSGNHSSNSNTGSDTEMLSPVSEQNTCMSVDSD